MLCRMSDSPPHNAIQQGRLGKIPPCAPTHYTHGEYLRNRTICSRTTSSPGWHIAKNHTSHIGWNATTLSLAPPIDIPSPNLLFSVPLLAWRMRMPEKVWASRSQQEGECVWKDDFLPVEESALVNYRLLLPLYGLGWETPARRSWGVQPINKKVE